jgi:hypothetical protein
LWLTLQAGLSLLNGLKARNDGLLVIIQPDAEIHFVSAFVLMESLHQRQDRVARVGVNVLEHSHYS